MDPEDFIARVVEKTSADLKPYLRRLVENFHRIGRLIGNSEGNDNEDILRSAVVFMHATLEDTLRSIAGAFLPEAGEEVLNAIPLVGSPSQRADKFFLGKLCDHKDITVKELIQISVKEHLQRETYNNVADIVSLLRSLGFETQPLQSHFGPLGTR